MPLPSDERVVRLANDLLKALDDLAGRHPGYRPVHAKGIMLEGRFFPASEGSLLTRAPHVHRESTPVTLRFSNGAGLPVIPDNDPNANPRGMAIRFHLAEHVHTDIVSHSIDGFPAKNGEELLELLRAIRAGKAPDFLATHPAALAFEQSKPSPVSFATLAYFGVTAFRFINRDGQPRYGRYRIEPEAGAQHLEEAAARSKGADYLFGELKRRIAHGPIRFEIRVQLAQDGDVINDATVPWPADRPVISLGTLVLDEVAPDDETHRRIIFDPIPRVDGIEPSDDPLLEVRAAIYLISGLRRRQEVESPAPARRS